MASNTLNDHRAALLEMVWRWDRRQRAQQTLIWLPRAALPGLGVGVALALIARFRPLLMPEQIAAVTLALVALGMAVALAVIWLRARSPMMAARHFDVIFGLDERVSTALELIEGGIHTSSALAAAQLEDARLTARTVRARDRLPLQAGRGDVLALLGLGLTLALLLALPNAHSEALAVESAQSAAEAAAVDHAADAVREMTEQTAADPRLDPAQRSELLQVLADSARALGDPNITPEQAFAAMNEVQGAFQQAGESLAQRLSENAAALQAASDALRGAAPSPENSNLPVAERLLNQIEAVREQADQMGQQPQPDAAQSLSDAAQALQGDSSSAMQQAASALQNAANAMQQGDQAGAQQSLGQAQDALDQAGGEMARQQQAQQSLEQAAQQAQQASNQINQAQQPQGEQAGQQQNQPGQGEQQPQQNQPGSQSQSGEGEQSAQQGQGAQGEQGDVPGQGQEGDAQQGASGENQGQSQQGEGQPSDSAEGDNPGGLSGTALRAQGGGAGDNASGEAQPGQASGAIQANNNPDGVGEGDFTPIYAPSLIGGPRGSGQMILEPDSENAPVVEGDFSSNPAGSALVPYSQVFRSFLNAATRSLETGYVPLGLRDVVRSYFTSIEPGAGQ